MFYEAIDPFIDYVPCRHGILVLELYSGCGRHGHEVAQCIRQYYEQAGGNGQTHRKEVMNVSIDIHAPATIVMDARGLTQSSIALLKSKVPNMEVRKVGLGYVDPPLFCPLVGSLGLHVCPNYSHAHHHPYLGCSSGLPSVPSLQRLLHQPQAKGSGRCGQDGVCCASRPCWDAVTCHCDGEPCCARFASWARGEHDIVLRLN